MEEPATKKKNTSSSLIPDWSQLPEELLHLISTHLEDHCFDVIHARSVCSSWRSTFPFPSSLLRTSYSLPAFADFPIKGLCTLEKIPVILLRVRTPAASAASAALPSEYFWGQISRDESDDHTKHTSSSIQCSVKVKIPGSDDSILMNMLDFQILSISYKYKMVGWEHRDYRGVAFLPLNKEGRRGEFVVLLAYSKVLMVLTSAEMIWKQLDNVPGQAYRLITFRGRFFVTLKDDKIAVIDPYSLEITTLMSVQPLSFVNLTIPSGDDALFIAEIMIPRSVISDFSRFTCRVSRLDEEAGKWVEVSDLGARMLFFGPFGNGCCSAKELPDGCGVTGNLVLFTSPDYMTYAYKYENLRKCWIYSEKKRGMILNSLC